MFYGLFLGMNLFNNKQDFFFWLYSFLLILIIRIFYQSWKTKKQQKERFLVLNKTNNFLQMLNFIFISFNFITTLRSEVSFLNPTHNNVQLGIFVLLLLFYWSGESVFNQNKKNIRKDYPNVIV